MSLPDFTIALVRDVFADDHSNERLTSTLTEARERGAELAILPEIPLNPWSPATREAREDDLDRGERFERQRDAARSAGIALVGGVIVHNEETGNRENTALVFDAKGELLQRYAKVHVPSEPGFWESDHYRPGPVGASVVEGLPFPLGVQICSDFNRPMGSHILAARGAKLIANPRATSRGTWENWKLVYRATALTTASFVVSACRPGQEQGVDLGGPCIAVAPHGEVLLESEERIGVVKLEASRLADADVDYPGYPPIRSDLYASDWGHAPTRLLP